MILGVFAEADGEKKRPLSLMTVFACPHETVCACSDVLYVLELLLQIQYFTIAAEPASPHPNTGAAMARQDARWTDGCHRRICLTIHEFIDNSHVPWKGKILRNFKASA